MEVNPTCAVIGKESALGRGLSIQTRAAATTQYRTALCQGLQPQHSTELPCEHFSSRREDVTHLHHLAFSGVDKTPKKEVKHVK